MGLPSIVRIVSASNKNKGANMIIAVNANKISSSLISVAFKTESSVFW